MPSQLLQALGQTTALVAFIAFMTRHIVPEHILTFGAFLQTVRLFGGELGVAFMTWFIRSGEQSHSNLIGLNLRTGDPAAQERLRTLAGGLQARALGPLDAQSKAASLLGTGVRAQAYVLTFIDAMTLVALAAALCLALVALLRTPPTPVAQ